MSLVQVVLLVIALAVLVGAWRTVRSGGRWRAGRVAAQGLVAIALALLLFPPERAQPRVSALVIAPGADAETIRMRDPHRLAFALPGVEIDDDSVERVPDLATALRRHPRIGDVEVLGEGLGEHDLAALGERGLRFTPAALAPGLVELDLPGTVAPGKLWSLRGRVAGVDDARLELRDRSDAVVASATADPDGRFVLQAVAKSVGTLQYALRIVRADASVVESVPVPLVVEDGDRARVIVLAGGADAELKYLRRWSLDAGQRLSSRIRLSRGIEQNQDVPALDAASLAETDLLVVDERAWDQLRASEKAAILGAVDGGLGVLLRVTGPVPASVSSDWAELGFRIETADLARTVALPGAGDPAAPADRLTRWPATITANDSVRLLGAADDSDLGRWRLLGRGRIGVWLLLDSYRLMLAGQAARFGALWSDTFNTLARARGSQSPRLPDDARVGQRSVLCALGESARIERADGSAEALLVDADRGGCALWWPNEPGWHALIDAQARWPIYVRDRNEADSLRRASRGEATLARVGDAGALAEVAAPMPRWPLFAVWLGLAALLWWLERRAASAA